MNNQTNFFNRELSWLEFNRRVLGQATFPHNPVLERAKFLSIVSSNLDEFFMIRVASLRDQVLAGYDKPDISGRLPEQQLSEILSKAREMVDAQYEIYRTRTVPQLARVNIKLLTFLRLSPEDKQFAAEYFDREIYQVLTPMVADDSRDFPLIASRSLHIGANLYGAGATKKFGFVEVPAALPRLISLPGEGCRYILLENVIRAQMHKLFPQATVKNRYVFRITRNADLQVDNEDVSDLLEAIKAQLKARKWGSVIRLELEKKGMRSLGNYLAEKFELSEPEVFPISGPLNLCFLFRLNALDIPKAKYKPFEARLPKAFRGRYNIFDQIKSQDILLHHPFDSFAPVDEFLRQAADDKHVLAIKQTLYRVSSTSAIVKSLARAARAGKQVTVLLEIKARFDEENNIEWGSKLEKAGCHVIYGLPGLKTHSKITLVVRRERDRIRQYVHLGTGNYNGSTAKLYTDFCLFTADKAIGADAIQFFNMLTNYALPDGMRKLCAAPLSLRDRFMQLIDREIENAQNGIPGEIFAKMNSLLDHKITQRLYAASQAGVRVRLLVRGICCLRPGEPGLSGNIEVRSIVGRFLEHSRIFLFANGGSPELYMSSADWMPRNLDRRVELLFPVRGGKLIRRVRSIMELYWEDNVQSSVLQPDGQYIMRAADGDRSISAQIKLMRSDVRKRKQGRATTNETE